MGNDSFNRRMELINVLVIHILFLGFNLNNLNQNEYFFFQCSDIKNLLYYNMVSN